MPKVIAKVTDVLKIILELLKTLKNKLSTKPPKKRFKKKILGAEVVLNGFFSRNCVKGDFSRSIAQKDF